MAGKAPGMRGRILGYSLGRAGGDDLAATRTALWAEVDQPVGGFDDVEVVLDDDHGVTAISQAMQYLQQLADILKVQACGGFVEDIEGITGISFLRALVTASPAAPPRPTASSPPARGECRTVRRPSASAVCDE